ncbi:hypothetical protein EYC80_007776 [Monilinia laxa]|uniref:RING-type E3 ubiquitin transferase n=1 Tax=Monilinia laxa TaxID=61186 RepID=A0A5N6JWZ6_MONLA|nr:hypothetical protein EYC80_007776 [Monilinia laxa]
MSHQDIDREPEVPTPIEEDPKPEEYPNLAGAGPSKETSSDESTIDKAKLLAEGKTLVDEKCGICTDVLNNAAILQPCSHYACYSCIKVWLSPENNHSCPFCRKRVLEYHYNYLNGGEHKVYSVVKEQEKAIENERNRGVMLIRQDLYRHHLRGEWMGGPRYGGFGAVTGEHITRSMGNRRVLSLWLRRELALVLEDIGQHFELRPLSRLDQAKWVEVRIMILLQSRENEEALARSLEKYLGKNTRLFLKDLGSVLFSSYENLEEWDQDMAYHAYFQHVPVRQQRPGARPVIRRMPRLHAMPQNEDPQDEHIWWIPDGEKYAQGSQGAQNIQVINEDQNAQNAQEAQDSQIANEDQGAQDVQSIHQNLPAGVPEVDRGSPVMIEQSALGANRRHTIRDQSDPNVQVFGHVYLGGDMQQGPEPATDPNTHGINEDENINSQNTFVIDNHQSSIHSQEDISLVIQASESDQSPATGELQATASLEPVDGSQLSIAPPEARDEISPETRVPANATGSIVSEAAGTRSQLVVVQTLHVEVEARGNGTLSSMNHVSSTHLVVKEQDEQVFFISSGGGIFNRDTSTAEVDDVILTPANEDHPVPKARRLRRALNRLKTYFKKCIKVIKIGKNFIEKDRDH